MDRKHWISLVVCALLMGAGCGVAPLDPGDSDVERDPDIGLDVGNPDGSDSQGVDVVSADDDVGEDDQGDDQADVDAADDYERVEPEGEDAELDTDESDDVDAADDHERVEPEDEDGELDTVDDEENETDYLEEGESEEEVG
ncbi:MAG: hypothetical protein IID37_00860 [Planctomycetes bacterium]|nr:hypothetical protein [Planctomycetota bacterium]